MPVIEFFIKVITGCSAACTLSSHQEEYQLGVNFQLFLKKGLLNVLENLQWAVKTSGLSKMTETMMLKFWRKCFNARRSTNNSLITVTVLAECTPRNTEGGIWGQTTVDENSSDLRFYFMAVLFALFFVPPNISEYLKYIVFCTKRWSITRSHSCRETSTHLYVHNPFYQPACLLWLLPLGFLSFPQTHSWKRKKNSWSWWNKCLPLPFTFTLIHKAQPESSEFWQDLPAWNHIPNFLPSLSFPFSFLLFLQNCGKINVLPDRPHL